jgi:hypothetical protein
MLAQTSAVSATWPIKLVGVEERKLQLGNRIYQRLSLLLRVNKIGWQLGKTAN